MVCERSKVGGVLQGKHDITVNILAQKHFSVK